MEKKTKIIISVGIIIVVLIMAIIMAMVFISLQEETYVYTNESIGFRLTLPKDWKLSVENNETFTNTYASAVVAAFNYQSGNKNYYLELSIAVDNQDFGKNMSTIVNETIELFSNTTNTNFTIESYNQKTINGLQAYEFNITGKYENSKNLTKAKLIKVNNNEKYFEIECEGAPSFIFDEHENEIEQIINSFVIL